MYKRSMSDIPAGFFFFFQERREDVEKEYPGMHLADATKIILKQWKELDYDRRKVYVGMATSNRERYDLEMQKFKKSNPDWEREIAVKKKCLKKPLSAYVYFTKERRHIVRAANKNLSFSEVTRLLSDSWKTLNDAEKKKYVDMEKLDRQRYNITFAEYSRMESNESIPPENKNRDDRKSPENKRGRENANANDNNAAVDDNGEVCVICMENPREVGFLHGSTMHRVSCIPCSNLCDECPICRASIDQVIHVYG